MTDRPARVPSGSALRHIADLSRDPLGTFTRWSHAYGDVLRIATPGAPTWLLTHPDDVHRVLVTDHADYLKDRYTQELREVMGNGLVTNEGASWKRQRRLANPGFHARAIRGYADTFVDRSERMLEGWGPRRTLDVHAHMMRLTLQIVARTLFGANVTMDAERVAAAIEAFMVRHKGIWGTGIKVPAYLPTPGNRRAQRALRDLDEVVLRIIAEHRTSESEDTTLIGMLLAASDEQGAMDDTQLRDEAVTMLMAGHETTAVALTLAWYLLAQNPAAEEALHAELDGVLGGRAPTLADAEQLEYTGKVVKEVLRLYPPVWAVAREPLRDVRIAGNTIARGDQIWLPQWTVHRDARWFADPLRFAPERWTPELEKSLPKGAYFPFSAGPRVCIGKRFAELEATLLLATIAQRYSLRLVPGETLDLLPSVTLRPKGGLQMTATRRGAPVLRAMALPHTQAAAAAP